MFYRAMNLISMSPAGQSDPEAECLSKMEEVYTCALHFTVSGRDHKHTDTFTPRAFRYILNLWCF